METPVLSAVVTFCRRFFCRSSDANDHLSKSDSTIGIIHFFGTGVIGSQASQPETSDLPTDQPTA